MSSSTENISTENSIDNDNCEKIVIDNDLDVNNSKKKTSELDDSSSFSYNQLSKFDYSTDYFVDLLVNEEKIKKKEDNMNNKKILTIASLMNNLNINKFNLEKYIIKNDKFKLCIDKSNNEEKYILVLKMLKILYDFDALPSNIFIFTKYQKFCEEIKKICVNKEINCLFQMNDKIINNKYARPDSLYIIDNMSFSHKILNHNEQFIVFCSNLSDTKYLNKYDVVLDFLETEKSHKKSFIDQELYKKVINVVKNNCFLVYEKNSNVQWYSENTNLEIEVSKSITEINNVKSSSSIIETSYCSYEADNLKIVKNETFDETFDETIDETIDESSYTSTSESTITNKSNNNKRLVEMSVGKDIHIKIFY